MVNSRWVRTDGEEFTLKQLLDNCHNEKGPLADLVKALAKKLIEMERSKKQSAKDIIESFREP